MQAHNRCRAVSYPQRTTREEQKAKYPKPSRGQSVIDPHGNVEIAEGKQRSRHECHRKYGKRDTEVKTRRVGLHRPKVNNRFVEGRVSREKNQLNYGNEERQT